MAIDVLQEKIRKQKNPSVIDMRMAISDIPAVFREATSCDAQAYGQYCRALLEGMQDLVPAVRFGFAAFVLLGEGGLQELSALLHEARQMGYYVLLDAPEILSQHAADVAAEGLLGESSSYPCDGVIISGYLGSDVIKPFLPYCRKGKKDLFVLVRAANRSAAQLQDLLSGSRLVHAVAADHVNRYAGDSVGKCGYSQVGILAAASSADSLRSLRSKYPGLFFLVDGYDYPNSNAKNCASAFDKFGHGAVVCAGSSITAAWKQEDSGDWLTQARMMAERMRKNLTRYVTIL